MRNFKGRFSFPAALAQGAEFLPQVGNPEDEDGGASFDVIREQQ